MYIQGNKYLILITNDFFFLNLQPNIFLCSQRNKIQLWWKEKKSSLVIKKNFGCKFIKKSLAFNFKCLFSWMCRLPRKLLAFSLSQSEQSTNGFFIKINCILCTNLSEYYQLMDPIYKLTHTAPELFNYTERIHIAISHIWMYTLLIQCRPERLTPFMKNETLQT